MRWILNGFLLGLVGCTTPPTVVEERTVDVLVPVPTPCALPRPAAPAPLRVAIPEETWRALDTRQRAAAVAAQGLRWQTYGEAVRAATAGCPLTEPDRTTPR